MNYFVKKGVFVTPGLIIDGKVVSTGKLLSVRGNSQDNQGKYVDYVRYYECLSHHRVPGEW